MQRPQVSIGFTKSKEQNSSTMSNIDQSEQDQQEYQKKQVQINKKKSQKQQLAYKKMVVGSGFSLDMTDFFKFKKRKKILPAVDGIFESISGGHLAWIILLYSVCNAAIMPAWIMSIKANKILRISWRFMLQAIVMIPFVLYQRRTGNQSVKKKYKLDYMLSLQGFKKVYISSLGTSIWFTIILSCFQWTYISHSIVLGSLSNFFLSINRSINHSTHQLEPGGQIFVLAGIIFVMADSYLLDVTQTPHSVWKVINTFYLTRQSYQRVIADCAALSGAFIISRFSQMAADLKTYYPPFLSMFFVNVMISINVALSAFYVNGATFDRDTNFGIWGLFTDIHFGGFFYMAVILSLGMYISFTLISKLFTDPIIPALAMTLQPFFATFFLNVVSVQTMPGSFSVFGYIFLLCGLFLILIGQYLLQKKKQKQDKQFQIENQMKQKLIKPQIIIEEIDQFESQQKIHSKQSLDKKSIHHDHNDHQGRGCSDIIHYN